MDGAWIGSVDISINKAFTARAFDIATKDLATNAQPGQQFFGIHGSNHGRVMIFAGGIPLQRDGEIVGAVGRQRRLRRAGPIRRRGRRRRVVEPARSAWAVPDQGRLSDRCGASRRSAPESSRLRQADPRSGRRRPARGADRPAADRSEPADSAQRGSARRAPTARPGAPRSSAVIRVGGRSLARTARRSPAARRDLISRACVRRHGDETVRDSWMKRGRQRSETPLVTVDERPVAALRGPGSTLTAVVFDDGDERACGGLLVPVTLHMVVPWPVVRTWPLRGRSRAPRRRSCTSTDRGENTSAAQRVPRPRAGCRGRVALRY